MYNTNYCKKIVNEFFNNEEVKKHINVDLYKNVPIKENIKEYKRVDDLFYNRHSTMINCSINPNFIISEYTTYEDEEKTKNSYLNAIYKCDNKNLYFNTSNNKNDYKLNNHI